MINEYAETNIYIQNCISKIKDLDNSIYSFLKVKDLLTSDDNDKLIKDMENKKVIERKKLEALYYWKDISEEDGYITLGKFIRFTFNGERLNFIIDQNSDFYKELQNTVKKCNDKYNYFSSLLTDKSKTEELIISLLNPLTETVAEYNNHVWDNNLKNINNVIKNYITYYPYQTLSNLYNLIYENLKVVVKRLTNDKVKDLIRCTEDYFEILLKNIKEGI